MGRGSASILAFLSLVFACSVFLASTLDHSAESLPPTFKRLQKRQNNTSYVPILGIKTFGIQPRLSITELAQNADQWNVYLLGLQRFQQTDQSDTLSYFELAGIHGRPFVAWDNVESPFSNPIAGYCQHMSSVFLPWHRPYLALWEQVLYQHIIDAVSEFPPGATRERYAFAALSWRQPYWDWATPPTNGQSVLPVSLTSPTVIINTVNGTQNVTNPLYAYNFHPPGGAGFSYDVWDDWLWTYRYPTNKTLGAVSQDNLAAQALDNKRSSYQTSLYNLFVNQANFSEFGNQVWLNTTGRADFDSIESIHDDIHTTVGGLNGAMTYFEFAAYDPIFMLHHAMIDRCFALWQALHPHSYVEPLAAVNETFVVAVGQVMDVNSPLEPFRSRNGSFWTSAQIRNHEIFGYTYPELSGGYNISTVTAAINKLYGPDANGGTGGDSTRRSLESLEGMEQRSELVHGRYREYITNLVTPKCGMYGSYGVYVFVGDFEDDPTTWPTSSNLAGTHSVFSAYSATDRQTSAGVLVSGTVPLTDILRAKVAAGELKSMGLRHVEKYLAANLHWKVAMYGGGAQLSAEDMDGFRISVVTAKVEPAKAEDEFPKWGSFTEISSLTRG